jgi:CRISPR/Cas system-associated exonuclease Cas4 (RecB family)
MSIYLSASSIRDYISCPQKVLYRLKKPFPISLSPEMIMGEIVHKVIEKAWDNRDEANKLFLELSNEAKMSTSTIRNYSFRLDLFFLNFRDYLGAEDTVEYSFKLPLYSDIFLVGKMDRISKGRVFDWKTGKVFKTTFKDVQCIIYEYAYEQLFNSKPVEINLASMADGKIYPYIRNNFYVETLFQKVIPGMIKTIKDESYTRLGVFDNSCFKCPYRVGCLKES